MENVITVVLSSLSLLFLKTTKIQGMSSPCNGNHFSSLVYKPYDAMFVTGQSLKREVIDHVSHPWY